ncbi:signal peptidase II [Blochmannia endosymbiont of Colobopsis nipponica]|uniref:signal peptidase II n=1 Tax=Blochmannia endosymbiont of Colobopsis nipponica TaxID=2681987 RepID=UPI00178168AE|nr:signal peptidase II [Blochmannia endosymbiont of Colobopsis nipponica]QOI11287.1 signal peptidase II [Blochmannia endosymbiont of Colobopsis nipponica]
MALKNTGLPWLWLSLLILILDFSSKQWVVNNLVFGEMVSYGPLINFCFVCNFGIVFGIFSEQEFQYIQFFVVASVFLIFFLLWMMYCLDYDIILLNVSYAMIVGGGLGNLLDRILRGAVIDFIDLHIKGWHWPIFNVADLTICLGVCLILFTCTLADEKKCAQ